MYTVPSIVGACFLFSVFSFYELLRGNRSSFFEVFFPWCHCHLGFFLLYGFCPEMQLDPEAMVISHGDPVGKLYPVQELYLLTCGEQLTRVFETIFLINA